MRMQSNKNQVIVSYKSPLKTSERMQIKLRISDELGFVTDACALFNKYGEAPGESGKCNLEYKSKDKSKGYSTFVGRIKFLNPGYRTFYISLTLNGEPKCIKFDYNSKEVVIADPAEDYAFFEQFIYLFSFSTPDWIKGGIMYQIFVDTFCAEEIPEKFKDKVVAWGTYPKWKPDADGEFRNNQFYGGNFKGIKKMLPYIKKLGVTVIYLTPILKSPNSNRYAVSNYLEIDEMLGTWDDFDDFKQEANKYGMKVIEDNVFNHASYDNPLIKEHPEIFEWKEPYTIPKCWWDFEELVIFFKEHPTYRRYLITWLLFYKKKYDGLRIDVADSIPDHVLKIIYKVFGSYILLEVWKNAITGDYRGFLEGNEADGVMNYQYPNAIYRWVRWGNYKNFVDIIEGIYNLYPQEALLVSPIFLSSHDIPRIPNIMVNPLMKESVCYENVWDIDKCKQWLNEDGSFNTVRYRTWQVENEKLSPEEFALAFALQKLAVFLQYTIPGLPSIFAGDEMGMIGLKDPTNRKALMWDNINQDVFQFYCEIGEFRIEHRKTFSKANFKVLMVNERYLLYRRGNLIFIINRMPEELYMEAYNFKENVFSLSKINEEHVLPPYGGVAIKK